MEVSKMGTRYYESSTSGMNFDRFLEQFDESTVSKMKRKYWTAKQIIRTKLGQKEDEYLMASDAELDAKLTLFDSIRRTSEDLLTCVDGYQGYIVDAAETEHELGKYLKREGREEKREHLAIAMTALGRALNFSAHRIAAIRKPLLRFYDDMRVFYERAVADCGQTIDAAEKARMEYRGSLLWMNKSSQELDPESSRQLESFREAQNVVRTNKERLDVLKTDALQKVDLLSASRVNLLLHLLDSYAELLKIYYEKTSSAFSAIANNLTQYEHYDFEILTDLLEPSRKIAEKIRSESVEKEDEQKATNSQDVNLVNLEEEEDLRAYFFGRSSPDEHREESPLGLLDLDEPEFGSRSGQGKEFDSTPLKMISHLSIGPLLPLSDCTSEAVGSIPRLAPPPTGPLEQPLMPSSLISFEAHNESPAEDLETTSNGNAPTSSASAAKAPTVMSQLIDLHHSAFPNPFDENNKTEWDELLSQCERTSAESGLI